MAEVTCTRYAGHVSTILTSRMPQPPVSIEMAGRISRATWLASRPAFTNASRSTRARTRLCARCSAESIPTRRAALCIGTATLFLGKEAYALLPAEDQEDEELVGLAKSKRKQRLAEERSVEKKFVKSADYSGVDVSSVQNAVNRLAKEGLSLETGDLKSVAASSESWVGDLKKAVADLSSSESAQKSSPDVLDSLDALSKSFKKGDLENAKSSFSNAVAALQVWIGDAGLSNQIKGL